MAGEIENPQKVIPKALMIGTPLVIATYFFTVWAAIRVARIDGADNWMNMWTGGGGVDFVEAAQIIGGGVLAYLMLMSAILSNIGLYAGYLATGARPQFQMSRDRLLPRFLGLTHRSWGTPWAAILLMAFVNAVLINFNFSALITIDVFLLMFPYVLIFLTAMILRVTEPDAPRSFRVPMPTWLLGVWVAFPIAIAVIALFVNGTDWMIGGLIGVLTGPIAYLVFKNIYKGTTDEALEGSTITPAVSSPSSAPQWKEPGMKGQRMAVLCGARRRARRSGRHRRRTLRASAQPIFGIPQFFGIYSDYLSGVHVLIGHRRDHGRRRPAQLQVAERRRHHRLRRRHGRPDLHLRPRHVPLDPAGLLLVGPVAACLDRRHLRRLRGLQERPAEQREAGRRAAR